jgi:type I site-specific restriction-modification system R (restriction) subunit
MADDQTPRAASGVALERLLRENHRYIFSLIHKFNQDVDPKKPYSERDDIIVISDEAHRTQSGKFARNMRVALPNAAFIGFTGTPLFKQDEITKRIFGDYVSRYDFKRSEEDGATVKLVYENRGEKLGLAHADLNAALAQYALGDDSDGGEDIIAPIEERVQALIEAIEATEAHLRNLRFDPATLVGAKGFARIRGLADAVEAVYTNDETKRRFEIMAREVFSRFKALVVEPSAWAFAERHDNIEGIYKKLTERRDTADVTALLKELHRIVNEAILTQEPGGDQAEGLVFDLSKIDLDKLREEFAKKVQRKASTLQDIRTIVEQKLAEMLARNPMRLDYQIKYENIIDDYNREKDRTTIEDTFRRLVELVQSLDEEQARAARENLSEEELALFDKLKRVGEDHRVSCARLWELERAVQKALDCRPIAQPFNHI